jgi:hypothetical protein
MTAFDPREHYLVLSRTVGDDVRRALGLPGLEPGEITYWIIRAIASSWKDTGKAERTADGWALTGIIALAGRPCTLRLVRGIHKDGRPKLRDGRRVFFAAGIVFEDSHGATQARDHAAL